MIAIVRRVGIAIGSVVAAWLVVGLVGRAVLPLFEVPFQPQDPGTTADPSSLVGLATIVLGSLIYRDIIRREPQAR